MSSAPPASGLPNYVKIVEVGPREKTWKEELVGGQGVQWYVLRYSGKYRGLLSGREAFMLRHQGISEG